MSDLHKRRFGRSRAKKDFIPYAWKYFFYYSNIQENSRITNPKIQIYRNKLP